MQEGNQLEEALKKKAGRTRTLLIILGSLVVAGVVLFFYLNSRKHEVTDNAQVDGTILSVRPAVGGFALKVYFEDNEFVKEGDTLVKIDDRDYVAKLEQAKAALASAVAQVDVIRSGAQAVAQNASAGALSANALQQNIISARTQLERAQTDYQRAQNMFKDAAVTQQQLDNAKADVVTAGARLNKAIEDQKVQAKQAGSTYQSAATQEKQISPAQALIEQRKAELDLAQSQLDHTVVTAPFSGVVSKKSVEPGQLLQAGQPVCAEVDTRNIWITANFKETQLKFMRAGQPVKITVDAYDTKFTGKVESFGGATGAKFSLLPPDNATGNFVKVTQRVPVRIRIDKNPEQLGFRLDPGMSVKVDVKVK